MIKLVRWCDNPIMGTFGSIYEDEKFICYSIEKPYLDNIPFNSCVPCGEYELVPFDSQRYGNTFALYSKENKVFVSNEGYGRYACLFHPANIHDELAGCIAPGLHLGMVSGKWAVTSSRLAFQKLLPLLNKYQKVVIE